MSTSRKRTEDLSVKFVNSRAEGWKFGVGDFFRMQLDIRLDKRMDIEANLAKKNKLGRKLEPSEKVQRSVWTQGTPPAYSFDRGHMFHELEESQEGIRRSIVVLIARPDPGALIEIQAADESGTEDIVITETDAEDSRAGFVDYEVINYKHGHQVTDDQGFGVKERFSRSQAGFADLLRTGA